MSRGTLRARLVATLLLLAVAGAVIGLVTTLALQRFLVDQLDDGLRTAGGIARGLDPPGARVPSGDPGGPDPGGPPPVDVPFGPGLPLGVLVAVVEDGRVSSAAVLDRGGAARPVPAEATAALLGVRAGATPRSSGGPRPQTSCAPRWPRSAGTPSCRAASRCPTLRRTRWPASRRRRSG